MVMVEYVTISTAKAIRAASRNAAPTCALSTPCVVEHSVDSPNEEEMTLGDDIGKLPFLLIDGAGAIGSPG